MEGNRGRCTRYKHQTFTKTKKTTQNIKPEILEIMEERRKNKEKDGDEYEEIK